MIDLVCTLLHFCASCAPNANAFTPWAGLVGGGAAAGSGVSGAGDFQGYQGPGPLGKGAGGLGPDGMGPGGLKPGDYGYADPASPLTVPNDLPLQDDPIGNAIPGFVVGPLTALGDAAMLGASGLKALGEMSAAAGQGIIDQTFQDMATDMFSLHAPQLGTEKYEDPATFHMGQTLHNPDGSTTNPDGTPGLPPDRSPAFNPDGTPATTDPSIPPDGS